MPMLTTVDWQLHVIAAYSWTRGQVLDRMRDELAGQIKRLTGRIVEPAAIWVDREAHRATLTLDGVRFRYARRQLVVVRPCVGCGVRQLESLPISDEADLGYALVAWEPRCQHCPVEDAAGWMDDTSA